MDFNTLNKNYNTEEKCRAYLEQLRWNGKVMCQHCDSIRVRFEKNNHRYHCQNCNKKFSVINGTIFESTRYPLVDWFKVITLFLNAKTGISAMQIKRNMNCSYKTAWYIGMRVRCAMIDKNIELQNIVEIDESYVGRKPRKKGLMEDPTRDVSKLTSKRGRGTNKTPIVGIVERNGDVVLQVAYRLNSKYLMNLLKENVNLENSIVISDSFKGYSKLDEIVEHLTVNHSKDGYKSKGIVHTNTIEGFWAIIKNSIRGNYISLSKKYLPFYLVQAQYIYNRRKVKHDIFEEFMKQAVQVDKSDFVNLYKPVKEVRGLVYDKN